MKVAKEKLNFLGLYSAIANKSYYSDKLKIEVGNGTSYFSVISDSVTMVTEVKGELSKDESFEVMIPVKNLLGLISSIPDGTLLNISQNNISFNSKARYSFEAVEQISPDKALDILASFEGQKSEEDILPDIHKIQPLLKFTGKDEMSAIGFDKGHYFSSNGIVMANVPVGVSPKKRINISQGMCGLLKMLEVEGNTIKFKRYENGVYSFSLGDTIVFVPETDSEIPDLYETDKFKEMNHTTNVKIDGNLLIPVLNRMSHVTTDKDSSSISMSFEEGNIIIGTKKYNESVESIPGEIDSELEGHKILFSLDNFLSCVQAGVSFCKNKTIHLGISTNKDALNIKIAIPMDKEESQFLYFFLILFEENVTVN